MGRELCVGVREYGSKGLRMGMAEHIVLDVRLGDKASPPRPAGLDTMLR